MQQQQMAQAAVPEILIVHRNDVGGCQNYVPFLGTLNIRGRTIIGIQKKGDHNFANHPCCDRSKELAVMDLAGASPTQSGLLLRNLN